MCGHALYIPYTQTVEIYISRLHLTAHNKKETFHTNPHTLTLPWRAQWFINHLQSILVFFFCRRTWNDCCYICICGVDWVVVCPLFMIGSIFFPLYLLYFPRLDTIGLTLVLFGCLSVVFGKINLYVKRKRHIGDFAVLRPNQKRDKGSSHNWFRDEIKATIEKHTRCFFCMCKLNVCVNSVFFFLCMLYLFVFFLHGEWLSFWILIYPYVLKIGSF